MLRRGLAIAIVVALCAVYAPAFAFEFIIGAGEGGQNQEYYAEVGDWAALNASSSAPGLLGKSRYSGTTVYWGPQRQAYAFWQPEISGYYHINLAWPYAKGEKDTAVVLYTGNYIGGPADQWGNSSPTGIIYADTMDMFECASDTWNNFTTAQLDADILYKVGIYGGYKGGADGVGSNRVCISGFQFVSATPESVTYTGPANGATGNVADFLDTGLSWTAGEYNSFYEVWFGETSGSLTRLATILADTSFDLDGLIQPGRTYYYRVDSGNVDNITYGAEYSFQTNADNAVPEMSSLACAAMGLVGIFGFIRRKK
ncbi:MAG: hypothetical protein ACOX3G_06940 [Armatimonadota bacterium]|jgi:hypothetical protein